MMRIFVNITPWSLKNELRAYMAEESELLTHRHRISKLEGESHLTRGVWNIHNQLMIIWKNNDFSGEYRLKDYEWIGCLGEQDDETFTFTDYWKKIGSPLLETELPDKKELKKLGLVQS